MTTEFYWLTLTVLMTALFWVPYVLDRHIVRGIWPPLSSNLPETGTPSSLWAQRAIKAHQNAVENLAIIVPAVLIAHALNISTPATKMAAMVYFFARLVHYLVYIVGGAGIPLVRTLAFTVGWVAQIVFLLTILRWI
jgi:uncharacterized MAPEG superfamily protein